MSSEDQLVSFFLYSFFIYPITGYLVSPHRKYPRWHGAAYAVLFLLAIALFHMYYEHIEKGQNYYQMLNVTRNTSTNLLKKAYKQLSLQLHPDKNKSPNASEEFRAIKQAFEVLNNPDTRRAYSLLGDTGAKIASKGLIDTKYIVLQMIVYYGSTMIFAFLMTFSEPTGDALITSIFGLFAMMFIESLLILEEWNLPSWFMPYYTSHNIVTFLHRLFPAYINCSRVLTGAFYVDQRATITQLLEGISNNNNINAGVIQDLSFKLSHSLKNSNKISLNINDIHVNSNGLMALALQKNESKYQLALSNKLENKEVQPIISRSKYEWIRNLGIYVVITYLYSIYKNKQVQ